MCLLETKSALPVICLMFISVCTCFATKYSGYYGFFFLLDDVAVLLFLRQKQLIGLLRNFLSISHSSAKRLHRGVWIFRRENKRNRLPIKSGVVFLIFTQILQLNIKHKRCMTVMFYTEFYMPVFIKAIGVGI